MLRTRFDTIAAYAAVARRNDSVAAMPPGEPVPALVAAIADLEYAIGRREALKRAFSCWLVLHIGAALVFYPLLALHVWSGVYHGLRWLP